MSGKHGAPAGALTIVTAEEESRAPSAPLRVLHLDAGREWRGGQRQVFLLARAMREAGHEPLVVGAPESPLVQRLRARGLAASSIAMRNDWDLPAARRLRALVRTWRPDVVHAHDARTHAIAVAALVGHRVPLVVTRRVPFAPRGVRLKYGRRVARFIAISGAVRDALVHGGVAPDRVSLVYSGVPAPRVARPRDWRAECRWPSDAVLCGVVGAMTAGTGAGALAAIVERLPEGVRRRTRLVLLGGPSSGSCTIGGVEAFRAGFVDEMQAATAGLDLLWHPSSAEGLGTTVIDAMALGVPPVAFASGALSELIDHERSGLVVPANDAAAFAGAAACLIADPVARRCLGECGPARAAQFGIDRMLDGALQVYARVLDEGVARDSGAA